MSGFLEDLTPQQAEELRKVNCEMYVYMVRLFGLLQFRAAVADIPNKPEDNDRYYLKWLRGRYVCIIAV